MKATVGWAACSSPEAARWWAASGPPYVTGLGFILAIVFCFPTISASAQPTSETLNEKRSIAISIVTCFGPAVVYENFAQGYVTNQLTQALQRANPPMGAGATAKAVSTLLLADIKADIRSRVVGAFTIDLVLRLSLDELKAAKSFCATEAGHKLLAMTMPLLSEGSNWLSPDIMKSAIEKHRKELAEAGFSNLDNIIK